VTALRVARIVILETKKGLNRSTKALMESWAGRRRPGLTRSSKYTSLNSETFFPNASKILASRKDVFASFIFHRRFRSSLFMICLSIVSFFSCFSAPLQPPHIPSGAMNLFVVPWII
jgi:hypothetical protein